MAFIENGDGSLRMDYYDPPVLNTPTLSAGGNLLPNTTYYYKVVACSYSYLNLASTLVIGEWSETKQITTDSTNLTVNLSWSDVGAPYYFIFRSLTGNFDDAEDFIPSSNASYIYQGITITSYNDNGSFAYLYRHLIRSNGIPRLSVVSGTKTPKNLYDFIITLPTPLNGMVDLYWAVPPGETTVTQFTGFYQPFLYRFDINLVVEDGSMFIILETHVLIRGAIWVVEGGTFQMGIKSASGMTSQGGFLYHFVPYFGWYMRGSFKFYNSIFWDGAFYFAPQAPGAGPYEKYTQPNFRQMICYDPSELIDSEFKAARRVYFTPLDTYGGSALLKNFKLEAGEYEQYYDQVTVEGMTVEGRGYGMWCYYDEAKVYNLNCYDCTYDIGFHMGSASGRTNYIELVSPTFQARGQSDTSDPYCYLHPNAQDKWMRMYFEFDLTVTTVVQDNPVPVVGAIVRVTTNYGIVYQETTDADGKIPTLEVREGRYVFSPGAAVRTGYMSDLIAAGYVTKEEGNPMRIEIVKNGFVIYDELIEVKKKIELVIGLDEAVPGVTENLDLVLEEEVVDANIVEENLDSVPDMTEDLDSAVGDEIISVNIIEEDLDGNIED